MYLANKKLVAEFLMEGVWFYFSPVQVQVIANILSQVGCSIDVQSFKLQGVTNLYLCF